MPRRRTTTRHTRVIRFLVFLLFLFLRFVIRAERVGEFFGGAVGGVGTGPHFDAMVDGFVRIGQVELVFVDSGSRVSREIGNSVFMGCLRWHSMATVVGLLIMSTP